MLSLKVSLHDLTGNPGWFKLGSAVKMPYSVRCAKNAQQEGRAETDIQGYQY